MDMGTCQVEAEVQNDMNNSGIGQDEPLTMMKQLLMETDNRIQLLDLSDDVLLNILKHCPPRDLKALGLTCYRLGTLVLDRTLWERVDARDHPVGMDRLRWLLKYAISSNTRELLLSGGVHTAAGSMVDQRLPMETKTDNACKGPKITFTNDMLLKIGAQCPNLTTLALEYCNLDYSSSRSVPEFPRTLKILSLRGTKYFSQNFGNLELLEELNVSECEWMEPFWLLPFSKLPALRRLYMRNCCGRVCDCQANFTQATRHGFNALQVIDLRESPVGDSEISSFGWVASLEELYVSPAQEKRRHSKEGQYIGNELPENCEWEPWEVQEPEFMNKLRKTEEFNGENCEHSPNSLKRRRVNEEGFEHALHSQGLPAFGPRDEYDVTEAKRSRQNGVNEGAGTSNDPHSPQASTENAGKETNGSQSGPTMQNMLQQPLRVEERVNICRRLHAMQTYMVEEPDDIPGESPVRLEPSALVSDDSVYRFGRADDYTANDVKIGLDGIVEEYRVIKPDQPNLKVLYLRGFIKITNSSLEHLAIAAPRLRLLDVTETRVNEHGVEIFKSLQPDCEVLYTRDEEKNES